MADNQPQKLRCEGQVGLLDGSLWLGHPVSTLSINGQIQGHLRLGGLSQQWITQELTIFDNLNSTYSDLLHWGLFGGGIPPINL